LRSGCSSWRPSLKPRDLPAPSLWRPEHGIARLTEAPAHALLDARGSDCEVIPMQDWTRLLVFVSSPRRPASGLLLNRNLCAQSGRPQMSCGHAHRDGLDNSPALPPIAWGRDSDIRETRYRTCPVGERSPSPFARELTPTMERCDSARRRSWDQSVRSGASAHGRGPAAAVVYGADQRKGRRPSARARRAAARTLHDRVRPRGTDAIHQLGASEREITPPPTIYTPSSTFPSRRAAHASASTSPNSATHTTSTSCLL
jgi:hypothetical protein